MSVVCLSLSATKFDSVIGLELVVVVNTFDGSLGGAIVICVHNCLSLDEH